MPLGAVHPIIARSGATKQSMARHRKIEDGLLRRSAPRNDDQIYHPGSQTHLRDLAAGARVLLYVLPSENQRAWGMPGARCTRSLACKMGREHTSVVTTGSPELPGIPARNGFNGFLRALPGDRAFLSPSSADRSANLTPASRRQDHTTSPSASVLFVKTTNRVHRIPSRVRDDREPPLVETRRRD